MCYLSIQVCSTQVGGNGKSFIIPNDKDIFCVSCFEDKIATKCVKCKQVLTSGGVTFRGEPWHKVAIQLGQLRLNPPGLGSKWGKRVERLSDF